MKNALFLLAVAFPSMIMAAGGTLCTDVSCAGDLIKESAEDAARVEEYRARMKALEKEISSVKIALDGLVARQKAASPELAARLTPDIDLADKKLQFLLAERTSIHMWFERYHNLGKPHTFSGKSTTSILKGLARKEMEREQYQSAEDSRDSNDTEETLDALSDTASDGESVRSDAESVFGSTPTASARRMSFGTGPLVSTGPAPMAPTRPAPKRPSAAPVAKSNARNRMGQSFSFGASGHLEPVREEK